MVIAGKEGRAVGNLKLCSREGAEPPPRGRGPDNSTTESEGNCGTWVVGSFYLPKITGIHLVSRSLSTLLTLLGYYNNLLACLLTVMHAHFHLTITSGQVMCLELEQESLVPDFSQDLE